MARSKPLPARSHPDLPTDPEPLAPSDPLFGSAEPLSELLIANRDFSNASGSGLQLSSCVLESVQLPGSSAPSVRLRDVSFSRCDLANANWRGLEAIRVEFRDCRLTGLQAHESDLQDLLAENSAARFLQLRFARLRRCEFINCDLEEADFTGSDLSGAIFRNCNLKRADLSSARLEGADLRGSALDGLRVRAEDLRGVVVEPAQALVLAPLFGLVIR